MEDSRNVILNCANAPNKLLFLEGDEAVSFFVPLLFFIPMKCFFLGAVVGGFCCFFLKWLKRHFGASALVRIMYWYLPTSRGRFRVYIPSYKREYIG